MSIDIRAYIDYDRWPGNPNVRTDTAAKWWLEHDAYAFQLLGYQWPGSRKAIVKVTDPYDGQDYLDIGSWTEDYRMYVNECEMADGQEQAWVRRFLAEDRLKNVSTHTATHRDPNGMHTETVYGFTSPDVQFPNRIELHDLRRVFSAMRKDGQEPQPGWNALLAAMNALDAAHLHPRLVYWFE